MKQQLIKITKEEIENNPGNPNESEGLGLIEKVRSIIRYANSQFYAVVKDLRIIRDKKYYLLVKNAKTDECFSNFEEFCLFYYELSRTTVFNYMQALEYIEKHHPDQVHTCEPIEHRKINLLATIDNEKYEDKRKELDKKVFDEKISYRDLEAEIKSYKEKSIDLDLKKVQPFDENIFYLGETYEEYEDDKILCIERYNDKIKVHYNSFATLTTQSILFHRNGKEFSLREYSKIQNFPNDFKFVGNYSEIKKQIGNAVDVKMSEFIIKKHIKGKNYMDLYSGCGGFSQGAHNLDKKCLWANDSNRYAAYSFKLNFPDTNVSIGDIRKIDEKEIYKKIGEIDFILAGCPCQGFSQAGNKFGFECDERNSLYLELIRFLKFLKPKQFIMENVPNILQYEDDILKDFNDAGYKVIIEKVNGLQIGSKQNRTRVFFIGELKTASDKRIGEKSQLEYLHKRNNSYDDKYGMFFNLLQGLNVEKVLELYGGVGIQTYYLENHKKIDHHTIIERNEECFKILKSMFPKKEVILSDNRAVEYKEDYDLVILDSGMNKSNFDKTIELMKKINSKYFIITETGGFRVKFKKNLSHEVHYQEIIQKLNSFGYKVEKVLYEHNYGLILINNEFAGIPTINKNTFSNQEWRDYILKIKK